MKCPACGMANSKGQKVCNHCGANLKIKYDTCNNGHNYDSSLSDCPYCPSPEVAEELKTSTGNQETVIDRQKTIITKPEISIPESILKTKTPQPVSSNKTKVEKPAKIKSIFRKKSAAEKKAAEEKKLAAAKKAADEKKLAMDKKIAEEKRFAEEKRLTEEKKIAEKKKITDEEKRLAEEKRLTEEKKIAEKKKIADEERIVFEEEIPVEKKSSVKVSSSLIKLVGWLVSYDVDPAGIDYRLYEGKTKIGRSNHCNIIVNDSTVSEEHVLLLCKDENFILQDELSANGTFVNGEQIEERMSLNDGDEITLGSMNFIIKII
jgi:hypothetical protein